MSTTPNYKKEKSNKKAGDPTINCAADEHEIHILVLVAGTTEPVNVGSHRATSYDSNSTKIYWDKDFIDGLEVFQKKHKNFVIFNFHGWSGDNRAANRKIAGKYLANRLCGGDGEKAFYSGYKSKIVNFHLLGHSHGGNVVNEMTQQIAALGNQWPEKWKVKSIIYLSTPFFNKLHPVKTGGFIHKDARVLNAYNKYDLTQRMLADFSLVTLRGGLLKLDISNLTKSIKTLNSNYDAIPFHFLIERKGWYVKSMPHVDGALLYSSTTRLLNNVLEILNEIYILAVSLNKPYRVLANPDIKGLTTTHNIFPDDALVQFKVVIDTIIFQVNVAIRRLNTTAGRVPVNGDFSKLDYVNALVGTVFNEGVALISALTAFLSIDNATLNTPTGSIWDVIARVIQHNIENYDNTYQNPQPQLKDTFLGKNLELFEVTKYDSYSNAKTTPSFDKFIKRVELAETNYQKNPSSVNLRDILFVLLAHHPLIVDAAKKIGSFAQTINNAEYITSGDTDKLLKQIRALFDNINKVIISRHQGDLEDPDDKNPSPELGQRGNLKYFLIESHSTSRRKLRVEVEEFFKKVIEK
jgi:hypothetical protein